MLDPRGRIEIVNTVKKLNREKNITVVVYHTLYGRSDPCQQGLCDGWWKCGNAGNSKRNFFPGRDTEEIPAGCTPGDIARP